MRVCITSYTFAKRGLTNSLFRKLSDEGDTELSVIGCETRVLILNKGPLVFRRFDQSLVRSIYTAEITHPKYWKVDSDHA